jgi:hypothetical protein
MARTLTLTFDGENELLLKVIEAYEQSDIFTDEEGKNVRLTVEEIALSMLMEGCLEWVQDVGGLPEDLEQTIRTNFDLDEGCEEGDECCHGEGDCEHQTP